MTQTRFADQDTNFEEVVSGQDILVATGFEKRHENLFPDELISLIVDLHRRFEPQRQYLLGQREQRRRQFDSGQLPGYEDKHSFAVTGDWSVRPIPEDLSCRRVEITGPVNNTKMVINMLSRNSEGYRADCAMLDFEDSMKPSWRNVLDGIANVIGAAKGDLHHQEPARDGKAEKNYALDPEDMAVLMVRVRGLHLQESHVLVGGQPVSAGLLDLATCAWHTAKTLMSKGKTPKFYVPKVAHFLEARWWDRLFAEVETMLGLLTGDLRATFLIETLPAAFQIEEILYELKDHAAGLNVGRWDKIFSDIKTLRAHKDRVMADRGAIDMSCYWMRNYALRLIRICHQRGAFALGGMAAFTPGRDPETRAAQTAKVEADKKQEADWGHDGCWVSHPYFIGPAMKQFHRKNQLEKIPQIDHCPDLLPVGDGSKTLNGLRTNVRVGIAYIRGWLDDIGCVAWDNLMEDLATLEISRAQVWQWLHHKISLSDGRQVTPQLVSKIFEEELARILEEEGSADAKSWERAAEVSESLFLSEVFHEFLSECPQIEQQ